MLNQARLKVLKARDDHVGSVLDDAKTSEFPDIAAIIAPFSAKKYLFAQFNSRKIRKWFT